MCVLTVGLFVACSPFLYKSHRGYHMIFHGMCPTGMFQAHYAFSLDAVNWRVSPRQAYRYETKYADGTSQLFTRVERPQLGFFGGIVESFGDSTPAVLYNGVCAATTPKEVYGCLELKSADPVMTWTLARQLRTKTDDPAMSVPSICHQSVMAEACNLNGKVGQDGKCNCLAAWTGPTCGELALRPANPAAGLHSQSSLSAWGGAVAFDRSSKRWVMFGNELVGGCGIDSWEANSRIVRASTADLDKPFVVEEVVLPAFASEPSLARLGDEWLLYSIGNSSSTRPPRSDCKDGCASNCACLFSILPVEKICESEIWIEQVYSESTPAEWDRWQLHWVCACEREISKKHHRQQQRMDTQQHVWKWRLQPGTVGIS